MNLLQTKDLCVSIGDKQIINDLNLNINKGEIHVIMGPNGTGKSTLSSVIMGDKKYTINKGEILFNDEVINDMKVDERSRKGIFLAMQYPSEINGISNMQFIKTALSMREEVKLFDFYKKLKENMNLLHISSDNMERHVNVGNSGGEKKKNEILQMLMLKPKLVILDEIDSGLDIDAIKIVFENVNKYFNDNKEEVSILIITHYPRILDYIKPDYVHIMKKGNIIKTGNIDLVHELDKTGYSEV